MTAAVKDFSGLDFDFALGEVYGLRVWKMDQFGRLRARNWGADAWRPGVNVAVCHAAPDGRDPSVIADPSGRGRVATEVRVDGGMTIDVGGGYFRTGGIVSSSSSTNWLYGSTFQVTWDDGEAERLASLAYREPPHAAPAEDCACGFYAYSDPQHEEAAGNTGQQYVLGIVKGFGRTLIGTKGFRCEKAEIVALRDPTRGGRKKAGWRTQQLAHLRRVYPDVPLLDSRAALLEAAPVAPQLPEPTTDEFWTLP